jgi:hypothetical protein
MEEEFIPYELAFRMKALGYDEPCFAFYNHKKELYDINPNSFTATNSGVHYNVKFYHIFNKSVMVKLCTAPTWQSTFKWFRERDFHTTIESYHCLGNDRPFGLGIDQKINGIWDYVDYSGDGNFDTYEEAQIKAIESILEIMEKKIS